MTPSPANAGTDRYEEAGAWCMRLADGELAPAEREQFETWLAENPENLTAFERTVSIWRQFGEEASAPEAIVLRSKALDAFRAANRRRWSRRINRPFRFSLAAAASLALLLVPGAMWYTSLPVKYQTEAGEREVAVLADGSRISLDAETTLDVDLKGNQRELVLKNGRAKFDVAKDPRRPFSVTAGDKIIVAVGTSFSVEILQSKVHVILYEGKVSVLDAEDGKSRTEPVKLARAEDADAALRPGGELIAPIGKNTATIRPTDAERSLAWESGQLTFVDEPLRSAVERVNRYSAREIRLGDSRVGALPVNGVYNAGDVEAFAVGVNAVLPVRVVDQGRIVTISSR